MSHAISLPQHADRSSVHASLLPQLKELLRGETDAVSAMANVSAALKQAFNWHWVGFYRVVGNELVLGPFQGPVACNRIPHGKGVCGTAWAEHRVVIVPDVELFPGHIACSALSRSEIVLPVRGRSGGVAVVLDIDGLALNEFDERDAHSLSAVCALLEPLFE